MEWNEQKLIKGCKKQSKKAQKILLYKYKDEFFGICLRYIDNKGISEEVLMDAFVAIFQKIDLYKENSVLLLFLCLPAGKGRGNF